VDELIDELESIAERLSDRALEALREAVDRFDGEGRPDAVLLAEERRLNRARRAVERAAAVLRSASIEREISPDE